VVRRFNKVEKTGTYIPEERDAKYLNIKASTQENNVKVIKMQGFNYFPDLKGTSNAQHNSRSII
jgi:hypothetical protein